MMAFEEAARGGSNANLEEELKASSLANFDKTSVFTVWRPISKNAMANMMLGLVTGKGLDIKGKAAKGGNIASYVPFIQIYEESHKYECQAFLEEDKTPRVFYRSEMARDEANDILLDVKHFMVYGVLSDKLANPSEEMLANDANLRCEFVNDYVHANPPAFGLDISEELFWQTYVMKCSDCSRPPGSEWDIGRASERDVMVENLKATRKVPCPGESKVVVFQQSWCPLEPRTLLVAYEESGTVKPVVTGFGCFLNGTRGVMYNRPMSLDQVQLVEWMVTNIGLLLDERARPSTDKRGSWFKHWQGVCNKAVEEGFYPKYPAHGYGDPKSYSITEAAVSRLKETGCVRHFAECFNWWCPRDFDIYDEFLVISNTLPGNIKWKVVNTQELQDMLITKIEEGFTFPINPKWVLCDPGWVRVYSALLNSKKPHVQESLNIWLPKETGVREKIEQISARHALGSVSPLVSSIISCLRSNDSTLIELFLSEDGFGAREATAIADALKENKTLKELVWVNEGTGDDGARAIADALKVNDTLVTLDFSRNGIGGDGAAAFADALKGNKTLTALELSGNGIDRSAVGQKAAGEIAHALERNRLYQRHQDGIRASGLSFYCIVDAENDNAAVQCLAKETLWEAATTGDGSVLEVVHSALRGFIERGDSGSRKLSLKKLLDIERVHSALRGFIERGDSGSRKLSLKKLLDTERDPKGSLLLHLAMGKQSKGALELCKFLVEDVGVNFDTAVDRVGRTARDIAMGNENERVIKWAKSVGTFLRRYLMEQKSLYKSATCEVHFATDVEKEKGDPDRHVAIKIMANREQFERELRQRLKDNHSAVSGVDIKDYMNRFDADHAVPLLRYHDEQNCLVMSMGERNVDEVIRYEGMAGQDLNKIEFFAVDIARALQHLHSEHGFVHGDLKPRNIVRIHGDYKLIDFDASLRIGEDLSEKFSTGYLPPEIVRVMFPPKGDLEELQRRAAELKVRIDDAEANGDFDAEEKLTKERTRLRREIKQIISSGSITSDEKLFVRPQMDIWAYGVVMYQMFTGKDLFQCDKFDNLSGEEAQLYVANWKGVDDAMLESVLEYCENKDLRASASDLLCKCLATADKRPKNFKDVLALPFLNRESLQLRRINEKQDQALGVQAEMKVTLNRLDEKLDKSLKILTEMQAQLKSVTKIVSSILEGIDVPKLICIHPLDSCVKDWLSLKGLLGKKVKISFVCPVTYSVPRDGRNQAMGYEIELPQDWVVKYGPALKVSFEVLRIAFAIGRLATGLPFPDLSGIGKETNVFTVLSNNLEGVPQVKEIGEIFGDYGKVSLSVPDNLNIGAPSEETREVIGESYRMVKEIAEKGKDPGFSNTGLVKVFSNAHGESEYVLDIPEIRAIYREKGNKCISLSREELGDAQVTLDAVVKEGLLEKKSKLKGWTQRYFVLRRNGVLTYYKIKEEWEADPFGVKGKPKPALVRSVKGKGATDSASLGIIDIKYEDGSSEDFRVHLSNKNDVKSAAEEVKAWVEAWGD